MGKDSVVFGVQLFLPSGCELSAQLYEEGLADWANKTRDSTLCCIKDQQGESQQLGAEEQPTEQVIEKPRFHIESEEPLAALNMASPSSFIAMKMISERMVSLFRFVFYVLLCCRHCSSKCKKHEILLSTCVSLKMLTLPVHLCFNYLVECSLS